MATAKIVRFFYKNSRKRTIETGVPIERAIAWCENPESSSDTAASPAARKRTRENGPWFDGYYEEK